MKGQEAASWFLERFQAVRSEVEKAIVGQSEVVEGVLIGLASNGHILLEGMPGLGKTLLVRSLSEALHLDFGRIQFTPDLMPADVTGTNVLSQGAFEFRSGPIFANILLADEINRATPKTQSAMLEAMQERAVTVSGRRHALAEPFLVMATQNPIEQEGTYPLPEAQLDRFFMKLIVPFPTKEELTEIVGSTTGTNVPSLQAVCSGEDVLKMREIVREVPIAPNVLEYAVNLVLATHPEAPSSGPDVQRYVRYGSSPRGGQSLVTAAKVHALLKGRFNVAKEDIAKAMLPTMRHRVGLNFEAEADGLTVDTILTPALEHSEKRDRDPLNV